MMGRGLNTRKMRIVNSTLNARATFPKSAQLLKAVVGERRKESGKMLGNAMEESPWAFRGRKFENVPGNSTDKQPPVESLNIPLSQSSVNMEIHI